MIAVPPDFRVVVAHPEKLALVLADDRDAGMVTYHERLRPIGRLADLIDATPRFPGFELHEVSPPETLVTAEGEYASLTVLRGASDGVARELTVGFVQLDDHYARLCAFARRREQFARFRAAARAMIIGDVHALAPRRRRRYLYQPPAGWQGRATTFETTWYPHDFPRRSSAITVFPAVPMNGAQKVEALVARAGGAGRRFVPFRAVEAHGGLAGHLWRDKDDPATRVAILADDFAYVMRLAGSGSGSGGDDGEVLLAMARSVHPIPRPERPETADLAAAIAHWVA
jgi:hypothetical protein